MHFPVSCTPKAQAAFDDAMKLQHYFWYQAAGQAFAGVLQRDPECVMALWGRALTRLVNPFTPPIAANLRQGRAYLEEAKRIGAKSEREPRGLADLHDTEEAAQRTGLLDWRARGRNGFRHGAEGITAVRFGAGGESGWGMKLLSHRSPNE